MRRRARILWITRWGSAAVILGLIGISIASAIALERQHRRAVAASRAQIEALRQAEHLDQLLYQKGFVAEFFLTGDEVWLEALGDEREPFRFWLEREAHSGIAPQAMAELASEYANYDRERGRAIEVFKKGDRATAIRLLGDNRIRAARLKTLASRIVFDRRADVSREIEEANAGFWRGLIILIGLAGVVLCATLVLGYLVTRRIGRPLYELVLRTEQQAGPRVEVHAEDEVAAIASHLSRLAAEVESSSRALQEERARAQQAEKMSALGEMAAALAHEVLNPLAGVKAALQLLARTEPSTAVSDTVKAADCEIARVDRMARRLLAFARPLQPAVRSCDLSLLILRVIDAVRAEEVARGVRFGIELVDEEEISADPDLLEQVLLNLALNACQAIAGNGRVTLRVLRREAWRTIEVIDDGSGLAPEVASKLFAPFVTTRPDGHGLGLAFSQTIAVAHGGRIEARSNAPDPGTTFVVYLPEAA